jgi:hypothetical protein
MVVSSLIVFLVCGNSVSQFLGLHNHLALGWGLGIGCNVSWWFIS